MQTPPLTGHDGRGEGVQPLGTHAASPPVRAAQILDAYKLIMKNVMDMLVRDSKVDTAALNRTCEPHCVDHFVNDVIDIETKLANVSS